MFILIIFNSPLNDSISVETLITFICRDCIQMMMKFSDVVLEVM